jgi:hypothetical protein
MFVGSALLTVLIFFAICSPVAASEQIASAGANANVVNANIVKFQEALTERYLELAGYNSLNIVESQFMPLNGRVSETATYNATRGSALVSIKVVGMLQIENGTISKGYTYSAQFLSSDGNRYSVNALYSTTNGGSWITTSSKEMINGSMNYYLSVNEKKVIADVISKQSKISLQFSNSSGCFSVSINSFLVYTSNGSSIASGNGTLDENVVGPIGHYIFSLTPALGGTGVEATITMPDGSVVDPGCYQIIDIWSANGIYELVGEMIYWENWFSIGLGTILTLIGFAISSFSLGTISLVLGLSPLFGSSSGNIYMYFETIWWNLIPFFGLLHAPVYLEAGYWTDSVVGYGSLGAYYYIPIWYSSGQNLPLRGSPIPPIWSTL